MRSTTRATRARAQTARGGPWTRFLPVARSAMLGGMGASLTDTLCTRCGLCCDGTLFADVELSGRREATKLEVLGLRIDEDADRPLLLQPCAALRNRRCTVY